MIARGPGVRRGRSSSSPPPPSGKVGAAFRFVWNARRSSARCIRNKCAVDIIMMMSRASEQRCESVAGVLRAGEGNRIASSSSDTRNEVMARGSTSVRISQRYVRFSGTRSIDITCNLRAAACLVATRATARHAHVPSISPRSSTQWRLHALGAAE